MRIIPIAAAEDPSGYCRRSKIRYWSNCTGDLYDPRSTAENQELNPTDLPKPLRYVYERLWEENAGGANCYLVETPEVGYGIALIYEYWTTPESKLNQDKTFVALLKDAEKLAAHDALWSATIYALENMNDMGPVGNGEICNELAVVFPAGIPEADFNMAKIACEEIAYGGLIEKDSRNDHVILVTENADCRLYTIDCTWRELMEDWHGDCDMVPANDAEVFFAAVNDGVIHTQRRMTFESALGVIEQMLRNQN